MLCFIPPSITTASNDVTLAVANFERLPKSTDALVGPIMVSVARETVGGAKDRKSSEKELTLQKSSLSDFGVVSRYPPTGF